MWISLCKGIGSVCVIFGAGCFGYESVKQERIRYQILSQFETVLFMIEHSLLLERKPVEIVAAEMEQKQTDAWATFFHLFRQKIEEGCDKEIPDQFRLALKQFGQQYSLSQKECALYQQLEDVFLSRDAKEISNYVAYVRQEQILLKNQMLERKSQKERVSVVLSLAAGVIGVLCFI